MKSYNKKLYKCEFDEVDIISFIDIKKYIGRKECLIIDLREPQEYKRIHIKGAVNIEYNDEDIKIPYESRGRLLVFYCDSGERALMAAAHMKRRGYKTVAVADRFPH